MKELLPLSVSCLIFLTANTSFANGFDARFRPFIEAAYELRLFEGALEAQMIVDAKGVETTIEHLSAAISALDDNRDQILPLLAETHGPNKMVVSRLEEISKRLGKVARGLGVPPLVDKAKDLREHIKAILFAAFLYSKEHPEPKKTEPRLSERAAEAFERLKALVEEPEILAAKYNVELRDKLMKPKVWTILLPILPLTGRPHLDDLYALVEAFDEYAILYSKDKRAVDHAILEVYSVITERLFKDQERIFDGLMIMPDATQLLLQHLRDEGSIPVALDVGVVPALERLSEAITNKLKSRGPKRFFLIVYIDKHAGLLYVDNVAGPLRALLVDSTGAFGQSGVIAKVSLEALNPFDVPLYMIATPRQADGTNCLSFALEALKTISNEPDIFANLKAQEPEGELNLIECTSPHLGLATQLLSSLPEDARRNCVVKRAGFTREEREEFIRRHTHVRLVHDRNLGIEVDKPQYLVMEKRAAANRLQVLKERLVKK